MDSGKLLQPAGVACLNVAAAGPKGDQYSIDLTSDR